LDLIGLIPSFGGLLYTIGAFIIALSVIVAVHEYGHYIVGRWSGIHPEVFSIGFGPVLASRVDKRGTRWQVAALPLGGYVKFLGDSDAASGKDGEAIRELSPEELRRTMHGAPLWARAATVAAGPAFNFALSFVVFAAVLFARGTATDPLTVDALTPLPVEEQPLRPGDQILAIDGTPTPTVEEFDAFVRELPAAPALDYTVRRDGAELSFPAPHPYPPLVSGISPGSAAMDVDLREGDVILSVDGDPISTFGELRDKVGASEGRALLLEVWRDGETFDAALVPRSTDLPLPDGGFETRYLIGITGGLFFEPATEAPGVFEAVGYGASQTLFIVQSSLSGLYHMAVGAISSCNLRGPIGIAETSGAAASQGWLSFVWFIAVLSTAVGLLNLFPVPVLDGGHLVFHAWEAVTGRPPSDRRAAGADGRGPCGAC
jgi:regulator of sigma E protease